MPTLDLPPDRRAAMVKVAKMSENDVEAILHVFKGIQLSADRRSPKEIVRDAFKPLGASEVGVTLYELYRIKESAGVTTDGFITDLLADVQKDKDFQEADGPVFRERIVRLLDIGPLSIISKAYLLQRDHQKVYCEAKILSDIRPVFSVDSPIAPVGAVLSHVLKVTYHENDRHREFFVALDSLDIKALKEVLDRAVDKNDQLEKLLSSFKLPILGT